MSAASNAPLPASGHGFEAEPGEEIEILGLSYHYDRTDSDRSVTLRAPSGSAYGEFMVVGHDGHPRKPTVDELGLFWAMGQLIFREPPLASEVRNRARAQKKDLDQARRQDPSSPFKTKLLTLFDASEFSRSDNAIAAFMKVALADPDIAAMTGARVIPGPTFRRWLRLNGTKGSRKTWDSVSMTGRTPRTWTIRHPLEIVMYWAIRATHIRGDITKNHNRYVADIYKINRGKALDRNFCIDPDGVAGPCERPAEYAVPQKPYKAISYKRFWRMCRSLKSAGYKSKTTPQAEYQLYGGGGLSDVPTHPGARAWLDDTPIPRLYFFDDETGIPVGQCTMTLLSEDDTGLLGGWNFNIGPASSSSVLRTVLHANSPKHGAVTQELLEIDADLPWLRFKPAIISFDNSTVNHGRSVEDVLLDAHIGCDFTGSGKARDKSHMERLIGTMLDLATKQDFDANYDIARMRKYGFNAKEAFDENEHILVPVSFGPRMLDLAAMTHNVTGTKSKDGRQPALLWKQRRGKRKTDKIANVDEFAASIGNVEFDIAMTSSGIDKFSRHYTPGAVDMTRIIKQFDDGWKREKNDIGFDRNPNTDDRRKQGHKVKCKYDPDDIGLIKVWNPYSSPPQWEHFHCTDRLAKGTPLWLHGRHLELAKAEALEYATPEQQAYVRARLFEEFAKVNAGAAERERRAIAKAAENPAVKQVFGRYVQVRDEDVSAEAAVRDAGDDPHAPVEHGSAVGLRKDAHIPTPRQKPKEPKVPATLRPAAGVPAPAVKPIKTRKRRAAENQEAAAETTLDSQASAASEPEQPAPYVSRRDRRLGRTNDDRRNAGTQQQSADRRDQRAAPAPRSNKTGEES
ncbi:hypothetical protein [Novosphingobium terrae]|uniref:hypothetical protein n=1 Tax=Novosphingobium terrae TaxID=2726189 RepID=UPI00197F432D|nr:hypothetical protein [Novosphingobium terrae]